MATIYVRSTDGNDADDGSTWALAKATIDGADAIDAAGDTIYVSDAHSETTAGAVSLAWAGTAANPTKVICGDDAAEPPTTITASAIVASTGANLLNNLGGVYCYGISFRAGSGSSSANVGLELNPQANNYQHYEECSFHILGTGTSVRVTTGDRDAGATSPTKVLWKNCDVLFSSASQRVCVMGDFVWRGGAVVAGSAITAVLVFDHNTVARGCNALVDGVDLSACATGVFLVSVTSAFGLFNKAIFRNCKLPASWSGAVINAAIPSQSRYEMWNCSASDQNYRMWIEDYYGGIADQTTTLIRTGGASDGTTTISWKMVTNANAGVFPMGTLVSPEFFRPQTSVGSAITVTVEILRDSATNLTDKEIWLEVQYLGTSGFPLSTFINDAAANILASAADQTGSSETWDTTGMSNANKQKLSVTFTPQEAGVLIATVHLCKASTTVYVDPKMTVT